VIEIIIASLIIMLASLLGVVFAWKTMKDFVEKNMGLLVSFSSGVFLVIVFSLGLEIFEHSAGNLLWPVIWVLSGMVGITLLFKILPGFHHHHDESHEHEHHSHIDARKIVLSDAVHNIGDGILLASSFAVSLQVGIAVAVSIFVHECVQTISQFFVLRGAGYSFFKALRINFFASSSVLIGSLGGFFLLEKFESLEIPLLAISAGAFLVVVVQDLIPESIRHSKNKNNYFHHIIFFLLGLTVMSVVKFLFGH